MMNENKDKGKEIPVDFMEDGKIAIPSDQKETHPQEEVDTSHEVHHEKKTRKLKEDYKKKLEEVHQKYESLK